LTKKGVIGVFPFVIMSCSIKTTKEDNMKKKPLIAVIAAVFLLAMFVSQDALAAKKIRWKIQGPFPAGMAMTGRASPGLVPWAWAVNGFLSVLTPVLAIVTAWRTGLGMVMLLGAAAYVLAYFASRRFVTSPVMGTKTTGVV